MTTTAANPPVKQVYEHQYINPETNQPHGRPTRIEYETTEELIEKMQAINNAAYTNLLRMKKLKPTPATPERSFTPATLTTDQEYQAGLELQNPATARKAIRKLIEAELPLADIEKQTRESASATAKAEREQMFYLFCRAHLQDFYDCQANGKLIGDYLRENQLAVTLDNLEIAFEAVRDNLAPRPQATTPAPVVNPTTTETRRVTPGIQPGQFSGNRPAASKGLTKEAAKDIMYNPQKRAERQRYFRNPELLAALNAALES